MRHTILAITLLLNTAARLNADEATPPQGANDPRLRAVSLEAVTAMLLVPDVATVEKLIDKNARRKNAPPGSALGVLKELEAKGPEIQRAIRLREVHFFTSRITRNAEALPELGVLEGRSSACASQGRIGMSGRLQALGAGQSL